jgi:hypothetical protein
MFFFVLKEKEKRKSNSEEYMERHALFKPRSIWHKKMSQNTKA